MQKESKPKSRPFPERIFEETRKVLAIRTADCSSPKVCWGRRHSAQGHAGKPPPRSVSAHRHPSPGPTPSTSAQLGTGPASTMSSRSDTAPSSALPAPVLMDKCVGRPFKRLNLWSRTESCQAGKRKGKSISQRWEWSLTKKADISAKGASFLFHTPPPGTTLTMKMCAIP